MGFYEDDRIRDKNRDFNETTHDENSFTLILDGVSLATVVELLSKYLVVSLENNRKVIVRD